MKSPLPAQDLALTIRVFRGSRSIEVVAGVGGAWLRNALELTVQPQIVTEKPGELWMRRRVITAGRSIVR